MEPRQQLVEVAIARGRAGDGLALFVQLLEPVEVALEQVVDTRHGVDHPALGHVVHHRFGRVDGLGDVVRRGEAQLGDLAGHSDEPAQHRVVVDDLGVLLGVGRGRGRHLEIDEGSGPTDRLEQTRPAQLVGDRDGVGRLAGAVQRHDGLEYVAVRGTVEVLGDDHVDRIAHRVARQQHGSEQRALGFEVLRGNARASVRATLGGAWLEGRWSEVGHRLNRGRVAGAGEPEPCT